MKIAIVGGGIAGLSAAYQAYRLGHEFALFEAGSRLGGVIETDLGADGAVIECGPEACLSTKPEMLELIKELGLEGQIIATKHENSGSFVVRDSSLRSIPGGLRLMAPTLVWPFLKSDLLSFRGKLRAFLDLVLPVRNLSLEHSDESLADFVTRRLGVEVLHYLAQPMIAGIYGSDPQVLSLDATMPFFSSLEQEHGSVIRGLRRMGRDREAKGARYSQFFSLREGFGSLVASLISVLPDETLQLGARVDRIEQVLDSSSAWRISIRGREPEGYDAVVLAVPAPVAADLVADIDVKLGDSLRQVKYRPVVTVNLSYAPEAFEQFVPASYGFVVPKVEKRPIMACTFSAHKWANRGSAKRALLRTYFGGTGSDWALKASDEELVAISESQLGDLLGLYEQAIETSVKRYPIGLPEYRVGHRQKVRQWRDILAMYPNLSLVGNYIDGVGMPDCVRLGRQAIRALEA